MKMVYNILYKNGHVDVIEQPLSDENIEVVGKINAIIEQSMDENSSGHITLSDEKTESHIIRLSEVMRVKITSS